MARRARALLLVMVGDEAVEEADAEGRRALRHGRRVLLGPGRAGDVEMRPGRLALDEALEELRGGDAARRAAAADVLHVRRIAVHLAVVALAERQPPDRLVERLASGDELLGERVVIGEAPGILVAERDDDGAGQRREVDHEARLEA